MRAAMERAKCRQGQGLRCAGGDRGGQSVDKMTQQVAQLRAAFLTMEQGDREKK